MTYSCAFFEQPGQPLAEAQRAKYHRLAEKAGLRPGHHVLEIGCGWGGFAEVAAGSYGCHVTGLTLSKEQARFARERMRQKGLDDRVEIRLEDYRDAEGSFDAVVSIEMLEAVGHRYLQRFVTACDRLLRPHGRVVLQSITIPDQLYDGYRHGIDWIRSYIFPGGHLPSLKALQDALAGSTAFTVHHLENIGVHYAETLRRWRRSFLENRAEVQALGYDDVFVRMWELYLAACEAGFAHGKLGDLQLVLVRPGSTVLPAGPYGGPGPGAMLERGVS